MTGLTINQTVLLLVVAVVVALAARRMKMPYTVGLVLTGVALALARAGTGASLTRDLIFNLLLPPLLFEAALRLSCSELRRDTGPILLLATAGVALTAAVVAGGLTALAGWPWRPALVFGVLIAATDPVSVIALFQETRVGGRLRLLVEAEALLNDGVAATLFVLAVAWALPGGALTAAGVGETLATVVLGGIAVGAACGGAAIRLAGRTDDALVETALTTVAAYGSFLLAEHWHASGVLATVTAGVLMGNVGILRDQGRSPLTARGREVVIAFWDFAAFVVNSLIFLLIGLRVGSVHFASYGAGAGGLLLAIGLTLAGRALSVYLLCGLLSRSGRRIEMRHQHVLFWGGLRGALALALALSLPPGLPYRDAIVVASFATVAFSVVVQGITMPLLLRALHLLPGK